LDFFARQAAARRQTRWLLWAFLFAVAVVVLALDIVVFTVLSIYDEGIEFVSPLEFAVLYPGPALVCTLLILAVIACASLYRSIQLRGGGGVVARSLGGIRIDRNTTDPKLKRLHNVVEEMAIASGVTMPEVYVLEQENGINALAAGHTPANAAVAVTQGALDRLSRDELQGIIAHEFSHVLNGDMRLNVRLIGWIAGLFVAVLVGRTLLRVGSRSRRGGLPILAAAAAFVVIGYIGLLAGRVLQAAVSRQRERLADASAVQFTRNPDGLKGAFVKIGGSREGSRLSAVAAEQVAHMLFAPGMSRRLLATHPPLVERIRELDPRFDEREFQRVAAKTAASEAAAAAAEQARQAIAPAPEQPAVAGAAIPAAIAALVGHPDTAHVRHARTLRLALPEEFREFIESAGAARALTLALLLARDGVPRLRQLELIAAALGSEECGVVQAAAVRAQTLAPSLRLPAVLQVFPALRRLARADREKLYALVRDISRVDARIDVFEHCLAALIAHSLRDELDARMPHGGGSLADAEEALGVLFAVLARVGAPDDVAARRAYEAGLATVLPMHRPDYATWADWPQRLDAAFEKAVRLHPFAKRVVVEGMTKTVAHDNQVRVEEAELLRTVCAILQCPLPPLLSEVHSPPSTVHSQN
jgi:Zn-dependent protease with chaperone function